MSEGERICKTGTWCGFTVVERDLGELVRCRDCVNWNTMADGATDANIRWRKDADDDRWCPVVRKFTRPSDWCCWSEMKGDQDER